LHLESLYLFLLLVGCLEAFLPGLISVRIGMMLHLVGVSSVDLLFTSIGLSASESGEQLCSPRQHHRLAPKQPSIKFGCSTILKSLGIRCMVSNTALKNLAGHSRLLHIIKAVHGLSSMM
jgi:hypothetical protein